MVDKSSSARCRQGGPAALLVVLLLSLRTVKGLDPYQKPSAVARPSQEMDTLATSAPFLNPDNIVVSTGKAIHTNPSSSHDRDSSQDTMEQDVILQSSAVEFPKEIRDTVGTRLANSASPLVETSNQKDGILESSGKNVEDQLDTNEVDVGSSARKYFQDIQPTRTIAGSSGEVLKTTSLDERILEDTTSGEGFGAPRGRSLPLTGPYLEATAGTTRANVSPTREDQTTSVTARSEMRKTSPDIQDIITGIVKLLNGNVKVQVNPNLPPPSAMISGRPLRPLSTRINNRGPPRITDVPLLPLDYDSPIPPPAMMPPPLVQTSTTRMPTPYPFDRPPPGISALPPQPLVTNPQSSHPFLNGIPLPEQVVPMSNQNGGYNRPRPHRPRPHRPRPGSPHRRPPPLPQPPPSIPPPYNTDDIPSSGEFMLSPDDQQQDDVAPMTNQHIPMYPAPDQNPPDNQLPTTEPEDDTEIPPILPPSTSTTSSTTETPTLEEEKWEDNTGDDDQKEEEKDPNIDEQSDNFGSESNSNSNVDDKDEPEPDTKLPGKNESKVDTKPKLPDNDESKIVTDVKEPQINESIIFTEPNDGVNISEVVGNASRHEGPKNTTETVSSTVGTSLISTAPTEVLTPTKSSEVSNVKPSLAIEESNSSLTIPVLLEPTTGIGVAMPVLEPSIQEAATAFSEWAGIDPSTGSSSGTPTAALPEITMSSDKTSTEKTMSTQENNVASSVGEPQHTTGFAYQPYRPRPGIVLDDTEYKPGVGLSRPIITAPPAGNVGEIFDVTVTAIQGPGGEAGHTGQPFVYPVEMEGVQLSGPAGGGNSGSLGNGDVAVITTPEEGQHFVSIDGKRTYINLFGSSTDGPSGVKPSRVQNGGAHTQQTSMGTGYAVPETEAPPTIVKRPRPTTPEPPRRVYNRRPNQPPVRIDTCIVGDASTCDMAQNELCRTEQGVSSCHCRPGYSRRKHRDPCRRMVSMLLSLRVDRLYERRVVWNRDLQDQQSEPYQQLQWEASRAIDSAMSMTPFSDDFLGVRVNGMYTQPDMAGSVFVNITLLLEETTETLRPAVRHDIQRHLMGVIHRRNNNVGNSALWVDSPPGAVSHLQDLDECSNPDLHDCHLQATCSNVFGSFRCACPDGFRDPWVGNPHRSGRQCETCPQEFCNGRGECRFENGQQMCRCTGNFYGSQCEVDGEVLGVAVGASVAAVVIIVLTLVCLCMWSRRWSREQKTAAGMGSPVFGYMGSAGGTVKTPAVGAPPYQVSLEDRLRWAQIADVMAQANHYAPEPVSGPTRPSSAVFGYPSLGTMPHHSTLPMGGTLPPVPLPRLGLANVMGATHTMSIHGAPTLSLHGARTPERTVDTSSSEEEDRADLLGRNFQVPRPKSRCSVANQSGIYYDVDYEQGEIYSVKHQPAIPLSTYTVARAPYYRQ